MNFFFSQTICKKAEKVKETSILNMLIIVSICKWYLSEWLVIQQYFSRKCLQLNKIYDHYLWIVQKCEIERKYGPNEMTALT